MQDEGRNEMLLAFVAECDEVLPQFTANLSAMATAATPAVIAETFRGLHTLKGSCGFLGFPLMGALAHAGEDLLGRLREGRLSASPAVIAVLEELLDALQAGLEHVRATGKEGLRDHTHLVARLRSTTDETPSSGEGVSQPPAARLPVAGHGHESSGRVRVEAGTLDEMLALSGELVAVRARVDHLAAPHGLEALTRATRQLGQVTMRLHHEVMKARVQSFEGLLAPMPRIVRDLGRTLGKNVQVTLHGQQTRADRRVVDVLREPLMHLLRNAVDHGLEAPEERVARGKPAAGQVGISVACSAGQVELTITDDGRGLDTRRIRETAVARGLLGSEEAATLGDDAVHNLVFIPGFSTAARVTDVSGRGVGMDAVKAAVERGGGTLLLQSSAGRGTTVAIAMPMSVAALPVLLVEAGEFPLAFPVSSVLDVRRHPTRGARVGSELESDLHILSMNVLLGLPADTPSSTLLVIAAGPLRYGVLVSDIQAVADVTAKPMGALAAAHPCFTGSAVLADGRVALIVDPAGLARLGRVAATRDPISVHQAGQEPGREAVRLIRLLVADAADGVRRAYTADGLVGVERIHAERLEQVAGGERFPLGEGFVPLRRFGETSPRSAAVDPVDIAVYERKGGRTGLLIGHVADLVEAPVQSAGANDDGIVLLDGHFVQVLDVEAWFDRAGTGRMESGEAFA